jgi:hypothetical protein
MISLAYTCTFHLAVRCENFLQLVVLVVCINQFWKFFALPMFSLALLLYLGIVSVYDVFERVLIINVLQSTTHEVGFYTPHLLINLPFGWILIECGTLLIIGLILLALVWRGFINIIVKGKTLLLKLIKTFLFGCDRWCRRNIIIFQYWRLFNYCFVINPNYPITIEIPQRFVISGNIHWALVNVFCLVNFRYYFSSIDRIGLIRLIFSVHPINCSDFIIL